MRKKSAAATVWGWQDDPASGEPLLAHAAPVPAAKPLAYRFPRPAPAAAQYARGTPPFRFWVAAEALRRGADFWSPRVASGRWQPGATLAVILDQGEDLNAYYDRQALNFFHAPFRNGVVYSAESPDVLCHEMGHAILDSLRPQLWNAASHEVPAFHESFGDMSGMLAALQLPSLRRDVLRETRGNLHRSSQLSRLAEQLGQAIRAVDPDAVERDCLRNAVNSFMYHDPLTLPASAPAAQLSSEPHSFSRVFTGAFLEGLAAMLTAVSGKGGADEQGLLAVSAHMADILVAGILLAPVSSNYYAQVAAAMVKQAAAVNRAYPPALQAAFVRRGILSMRSAADAGASGHPARRPVRVVRAAPVSLPRVVIDGTRFGLKTRRLLVQAPESSGDISAAVAVAVTEAIPSSAAVAEAFTADLFRRGKVDIGTQAAYAWHGASPHVFKTHRLIARGRGVVLERLRFDCGLHAPR
jgi:hypothetical protein